MELERRALIPVPLGHNSLFAPALDCDRTLVVFVHGFRGKALSTWLSFPDFVDEFDGLRNADLLFYGYASSPRRMQNIAINLRSHRHQMVGILVLEEQLTLVRHRFALVQHQLDYAVVGPPYRLVLQAPGEER
jgi:hypothetical protein